MDGLSFLVKKLAVSIPKDLIAQGFKSLNDFRNLPKLDPNIYGIVELPAATENIGAVLALTLAQEAALNPHIIVLGGHYVSVKLVLANDKNATMDSLEKEAEGKLSTYFMATAIAVVPGTNNFRAVTACQRNNVVKRSTDAFNNGKNTEEILMHAFKHAIWVSQQWCLHTIQNVDDLYTSVQVPLGELLSLGVADKNVPLNQFAHMVLHYAVTRSAMLEELPSTKAFNPSYTEEESEFVESLLLPLVALRQAQTNVQAQAVVEGYKDKTGRLKVPSKAPRNFQTSSESLKRTITPLSAAKLEHHLALQEIMHANSPLVALADIDAHSDAKNRGRSKTKKKPSKTKKSKSRSGSKSRSSSKRKSSSKSRSSSKSSTKSKSKSRSSSAGAKPKEKKKPTGLKRSKSSSSKNSSTKTTSTSATKSTKKPKSSKSSSASEKSKSSKDTKTSKMKRSKSSDGLANTGKSKGSEKRGRSLTRSTSSGTSSKSRSSSSEAASSSGSKAAGKKTSTPKPADKSKSKEEKSRRSSTSSTPATPKTKTQGKDDKNGKSRSRSSSSASSSSTGKPTSTAPQKKTKDDKTKKIQGNKSGSASGSESSSSSKKKGTRGDSKDGNQRKKGGKEKTPKADKKEQKRKEKDQKAAAAELDETKAKTNRSRSKSSERRQQTPVREVSPSSFVTPTVLPGVPVPTPVVVNNTNMAPAPIFAPPISPYSPMATTTTSTTSPLVPQPTPAPVINVVQNASSVSGGIPEPGKKSTLPTMGNPAEEARWMSNSMTRESELLRKKELLAKEPSRKDELADIEKEIDEVRNERSMFMNNRNSSDLSSNGNKVASLPEGKDAKTTEAGAVQSPTASKPFSIISSLLSNYRY